MKVLLVNPSVPRDVPRSVRAELRYDPPLAALYLGSFLAKKGIKSEIIDTVIDDIDLDKVNNNEYDLISFTVFIGEFQKKARELAGKIKTVNPHIPIVFGGVMASIFPEEFLQEYPVDYVIRYEGENSLYELVLSLEGKFNISDIKGLSYKNGPAIVHNPPRYLEKDLDSFPVPMWELFGSSFNVRQIPYYFSIMTSKGCPFKCSFCYNRQVEDDIQVDSPTWRFRSAEHVIAEVSSIHSQTGTRVFTFGDDNFLVNRERAIKILDYFKKYQFYIEQCIGHMNNFNSIELTDAMGGVVQTGIYAIESASPRLLELLQKNVKIDLVPQVNKRLFDKGISTVHTLMVGLPTETDADLAMNVSLMKKLKEINPYVRGQPYLYLPLPNTPLESYIHEKMGFDLPHSLIYYENARFDFEGGEKYRPWIDADRYAILKDYVDVFRDLFQINNLAVSENTIKILDENPQLKHIFGNISTINRPSVHYIPYILDRVLRNEPIDLEHDLIRKVKG